MIDPNTNETFPVPIIHCPSYCPEELASAIRAALSPQLERTGSLCGKSVLLKPNLLAWRRDDDPACVHPQFIVETAKAFLDAGAARVELMETPATQRVSSILQAMGIADELKRLGVKASNFADYRKIDNLPENVFYRNLEIANEYREFDYTASIAKAKTHAMMTLTLCVKNLFGFINGSDRLAWHLSVGRDYSRFADMLLDLYLSIHPQFNLLDGIVCMEGNGPGSGTPTERNFVAGSSDALAMERILSPILGAPQTPVLMRAAARNLLPEASTPVRDFEIPPIKLPEEPKMELAQMHLGVGIPKFAQKFLHSHMLARPFVDPKACIGCGLCARMCPPQTLRIINNRPHFDLKTCIRCFCCQEHCPKGAITVKKTLFMRFCRKVETMLR